MLKRILFILVVLLLATVQAVAQGVITYGSATVVTITPEAPIAIFTFQGNEGDQVTVQGISITPGLDLTATIQSGAEILINSTSDPYAVSADDVRADVILPSTGTYLVLITSASGSTGDFLLKLAGQPIAEKTIITGIPADVPINAGETSYYSYTGTADETVILNLVAQSPDLQFLAVVRNNTGQIQTTSSGASAIISLVGEGPYEIALSGITETMTGVVNVDLADISPQPEPTQDAVPTDDTTDPPPPLVTEEVVVDTGACFISATSFVNIRSGPSTDDAVITQTTPGQAYAVVSVSGDWYQIDVPNVGTGWVSSTVVTTTGDCSAVPVVGDTTPPTVAPPTEVIQATETAVAATPTATDVTNQEQPTATQIVNQEEPTPTYTASYTPTEPAQEPTATFTPSYTPTTPPPPQLAPEDARFNNPLNIPLDSTTSVLDFVSYPDGDTEDRVRWDITGMNANSAMSGGRARLVISVTCFGENTDQIQFFTGGQTYSCGSTIVDQEVTFNSKTGSVVITAVGGEGTYVQWVLTGTATRVN